MAGRSPLAIESDAVEIGGVVDEAVDLQPIGKCDKALAAKDRFDKHWVEIQQALSADSLVQFFHADPLRFEIGGVPYLSGRRRSREPMIWSEQMPVRGYSRPRPASGVEARILKPVLSGAQVIVNHKARMRYPRPLLLAGENVSFRYVRTYSLTIY